MRVLIIDDTQADHDIAVECLKDTGGDYEFFHAYSAKEGVEQYHARDNIDCVLLDYRMPGNDGLEVLRQLTAEDKIVPVIMMTGEGDEFVAVTAMKLGSQDYIPKRILTPSALKRAVERAVERTEMLVQMERYRADLERSNNDLEQFANIVAHDLKAPLRAITQHLALVSEKNKDVLDEKSRRSVEFAVEGATRMRCLIEALFDYARLGFCEPSFGTVKLEALMEQTKRDLSAVIEERSVRITCDPLPEVQGDPVLLAQLLQNLIANAIKYCNDTPQVHVSAVHDGNRWRIGVKDNGIGIPAGQHRQVFAIFRRLHHADEYPGIGLGLAICERVVKRHGGSINVESSPGAGSLFSFDLAPAEAIPIEERKVAHA